ncbi:hypothetical protein swp_0824 [Shewanella piezotolerans WP3]|uniref:DUF4347 domain-containing protein n=1 Tax=Shewanella piezotolerans (strain WP3 / JCM 13877) TaxID=225849 RepID=B8CJ09_SHEPW|nr:DUF4347 domain-containing protein [Shewanella piezotolerans]ACJ27635.1 hypothetical protein swp_0824 [Shewanella piezotolerans WP3]
MNSLNQDSTYSTFNDNLTHLELFSEAELKQAPRQIKFPRQFPISWLLLLCCLLLVNEVTATEQPIAALLNVESSKVLLIVDNSVQDLEGLLHRLHGDIDLLVLNETQEPFSQINQAIGDEQNYVGVVMVAAAASDAIYIAGRWVDKHYLVQHKGGIAQFGEKFTARSNLMLLTSDSLINPKGDGFLTLFTGLTQLDVSVFGGAEHHYLAFNNFVGFF